MTLSGGDMYKGEFLHLYALLAHFCCESNLRTLFGMFLPYFPGAKRRGNENYFEASEDDCGCQLLQHVATAV